MHKGLKSIDFCYFSFVGIVVAMCHFHSYLANKPPPVQFKPSCKGKKEKHQCFVLSPFSSSTLNISALGFNIHPCEDCIPC